MAVEASNQASLEDQLLRDEIAESLRLELSLLKDITNNFSEEQEIGRGAFGIVYKGLLGDRLIAVKKLHSSLEIEDKTFEHEVDCLVRVKHRNIVGFIGYCGESHLEVVKLGAKNILAESRIRLLCFEYMPNGSLHRHLTDEPCELQWHVCYQIIRGICQGLHYLHEKHIIHLDLKPDNILLDDDMMPQIADFGLSRLLGEGKSRTSTQNRLGTLGYMAPEYIDDGAITVKSDIYSLGVIIRRIVIGRKTGQTIEKEEVLEIWRSRLDLEQHSPWRHTPLETGCQQVKECIEISTSCMELKPENRPVTGDIIRRLDEMGSGDWSASLSKLASGISTSPVGQISSLSKLMDERSKVLPLPLLAASAKGTGDTTPNKVDERMKSFWLETRTGAKCCMLSSRSLRINWGETPQYWRWISLPSSRFAECAELLDVYWFVVSGEIATKDLSAGSSYEVYLVYKLAGSFSGLEGGQTSSVRLHGERIVATSRVSLDPDARGIPAGADVTYPVARGDGWMELRLGEFANHGVMLMEKAVIVDVREENDHIKKSGVIVEGMEFRASN